MICTFFGHRKVSHKIEPILYETLTYLTETKNVDLFYVGNQGDFDFLVRKCLKKLKNEYPDIDYAVVLAYLPKTNDEKWYYSDTVYPEGLELIPPKYAISKRNEWMIKKADYVVTYVSHSSGGAAKYKRMAEKKGKLIIEITEL